MSLNGLHGEAVNDAGVDASVEDAPVGSDFDASADTMPGDATISDRQLTCGSQPISSVQAIATDGLTNKTASLTLTNVTAHDALIVALDYDSFTGAALTDTQGNVYRAVVGPYDAVSARHWIFAAFDVVGGSNDTLTATLDAVGQHYFELYVHEFHNVAAFDVGKFSSGTQTGTDGMNSGSAITQCNNEIIFGFGVTGHAQHGTGFIQLLAFHLNVTEFEVASTRGTYATTATMTSGSQWTMLMAAFAAN